MGDLLNQRQCRFKRSGPVRSLLLKVLAAIVLLPPLVLSGAARGDFESSPLRSQEQVQQPRIDETKTPPKKPDATPESAGSEKSAPPAKATKSGSGKRPKKKNK